MLRCEGTIERLGVVPAFLARISLRLFLMVMLPPIRAGQFARRGRE